MGWNIYMRDEAFERFKVEAKLLVNEVKRGSFFCHINGDEHWEVVEYWHCKQVERVRVRVERRECGRAIYNMIDRKRRFQMRFLVGE